MSNRSLLAHVWMVSLFLAGCGEAEPPLDDEKVTSAVQSPDIAPTGKGIGTTNKFGKGEAGRPASGGDNGIVYHGGPVMLGAVNVYYIWYGDWSGNTAPTILEDFAASIGGSPYYNINTSYTNGAGVALSNAVVFAGRTTDAYSRGKSLSDSQIRDVVSSAILQQRLPLDAKGVYFVLTSADVTASSGFCSQYCGWHSHASVSGVDIKYSFIGNPDRCP